MKKLICFLPVLIWLFVCLSAGVFAEEEPLRDDLKEIRCAEWRFSTRIPTGWNVYPFSSYDPEEYEAFIGGGFILSPGGKDDMPQIRIARRNHFDNVGFYLTSCFYYYLWKCSVFDTEDCTSYKLGGRTMYGVSAVIYGDHDEELFRELRLIPVSDNQGTEFVARYTKEDEESVLSLLDTVIRCYQPEDPPPQPEARFLPRSHTGDAELNLQNGKYLLRVEDADQIETEGYFTAVLCQTDVYSSEDVHAMQPGDTILIRDRVLTIVSIEPNGMDDDGSWYEVNLSAVEHAIKDQYYRFTLERSGNDYVAYFGNDNHSASRVSEVRIQVPQPNRIRLYNVFEYEYTLISDDLLGNLQDPAMFGFGWTEYSHSCEFRDGQLVRVESWDYPFGPEDPFME